MKLSGPAAMAKTLLNATPVAATRTHRKLVLASASPRRREIMQSLGFEFQVIASEVDEGELGNEAPQELAVRLARAKAQDVAAKAPGCAVVAADTVVSLDGVSLGKPECTEHAISMLESLSGRSHTVYTGVAVASGGRLVSGVEETEVRFRTLMPGEIELYVSSGAGMDKAGAYGIQDEPFLPVESITGSYLNVVGLPAALLASLLQQSGVIDPATAREIAGKEPS